MKLYQFIQNFIFSLSNLSYINWHAWLPSRGNVLTLVIVVAMLWAQSAHALPWSNPFAAANSTNVWPYQGRLNSSTGIPLTAAVPMTFKLYSASSGGTALWQEQWVSVQVTGGLFNVMLGSLTAIPQSIVNGNSNLWLGITVSTDAEMTPRVQLGSVPFAGTIPNGSITAAKQAPRLRAVSMQLEPDNCGGVGYYGHLGPMSSFAVGSQGSCTARGVAKLPYDWVVGTNLRIGVLGISRSSSQSTNIYGNWATLNKTDGNWEGYFSNTVTLGTMFSDITLVNISSNDVSKGDTVVVYFYFPGNTAIVDVTGLYLEYTAQP